MWSSTWSSTWPTNIIFLEAKKPYPHYYQTCHRTYHPSSKMSIDPTLVASRPHHWLATLVAKHDHHQLVNQYSKTFTNIAIILIDAIYKEFYECWLSETLIIKLHLKPIRAWSSLLLAYQLIAMPTFFWSGGWVRKALGHQKSRK